MRFARPTGRYAVGTVSRHWTDPARPALFDADPAARRELIVQLWYPARVSPGAAPAPYVRNAPALAPGLASLAQQNAQRLFPRLRVPVPSAPLRMLGRVRTHAVARTPVAGDEARYPVLVFLEGLNGLRQMNTFQAEELASHGYIVAALDQPGTAAAVVLPDGRTVLGRTKDQLEAVLQQSIAPSAGVPALDGHPLPDGIVPHLAQDAAFCLDRLRALDEADPTGILTGRIDTDRAGVFGVSLGGIVAAQAAHRDPRLRACLVMEAPMPHDVVTDGLRQPTMWIASDADTWRMQRWTDRDITQHHSMRAVFEKSPGGGWYLELPRVFHLNLTDVPLLISQPIGRLLRLLGPVDARRVHRVVNDYTLAFFDRHLRGLPAALLDKTPSRGVRIESRPPRHG